MSIDAKACLGTHDVLFITLDTLRYDVAMRAFERNETPNLAALLPPEGWEKRHTPGSFTYAAHSAFFAGFLPTPACPREVDPAAHRRLFATRFPGSATSGQGTLDFDAADIVTGFADAGYRTICIGGVGFFNKQSPLGSALPNLFSESWWREEFGVTCKTSTANQVAHAMERLATLTNDERVFLFLNVSAMHQPNCHHTQGATEDTPETQQAALAYVDAQLPPLIEAMRTRAPAIIVITADHGTAYGDDGYSGHRLGHSCVWDVPYLETVIQQAGGHG